MMNQCVRLIPMLMVMGIIFYISDQPGDSLSLPNFIGADKVAHFCAYATLGFTILVAHGKKRRHTRPLFVFSTLLSVVIIYGVLDEFHQSFIPLRSVSFLDLVADACGGLFVGAMYYYWRWKKGQTT